MKLFERIIIKLVVIQLICLVIAQAIVLYSPFTPYLSKIEDYEGVEQSERTETMETIFNNE